MSNTSLPFSPATLLATPSSLRHPFPLVGTQNAKPALPSARTPMDRIDITRFINFKLDPSANNYTRWARRFYAVLTTYNCTHHVDREADPHLQDAKWRNDDLTILLWFYATICDELFQVVRGAENTAYTVWDKLRTFFRDNQPGQAMHISEEFLATVQGDMTVGAYCHRLKALADALADVDEPVNDEILTLHMIRGLNNRFHVMATILPEQLPFPTFDQARSLLLLEEIALDEREKAKGSFTPTINTTTSCNSTPGGSNNGSQGGRGGARTLTHCSLDRGRSASLGGSSSNCGHNRGDFSNTRRGQSAQQQQRNWMGHFAPWGVPFPSLGQPSRTQWAPPNVVDVFRSHSTAPTQAYSLLYSEPSSSTVTPPSPDQFSVIGMMPSNTSSTPPLAVTSTWTPTRHRMAMQDLATKENPHEI